MRDVLAFLDPDGQAGPGDRRRLPLASGGRLELEATAQHFGGVRWWFACPRCGRRCGVLYQTWDRGPLDYRRCARLTYGSQRESVEDRLYRRAFKRWDRIGTDYSVVPRRHARPEGMHWRTWYRIRQVATELETRALGGAFAQLFPDRAKALGISRPRKTG